MRLGLDRNGLRGDEISAVYSRQALHLGGWIGIGTRSAIPHLGDVNHTASDDTLAQPGNRQDDALV